MIVRLHYTTTENGNWRELLTDTTHELRVMNFLSTLSKPLPTNFTTLTPGQTGLKDMIVVHSFMFSSGVIWDARNGIRPQKTSSLEGAYQIEEPL